MPLKGKTASNMAELGVAIADEEPESPAGVAGRVGGDAEDVDAAGGVLDGKERVQPLQGEGVDMKQVAGQDPARLGS